MCVFARARTIKFYKMYQRNHCIEMKYTKSKWREEKKKTEKESKAGSEIIDRFIDTLRI